MQSLCAFFKARGVLRTRELLFKRVQTEAVVDALVEDTAQLAVALKDQDYPAHRPLRAATAAASPAGPPPMMTKSTFFIDAAPSQNVSLFVPTMILEFPPDFVISLWSTPSSRAKISMTRGLQKPA